MFLKKETLQKYWTLYLLTIGIVLVLRHFSKTTDSDVISWMLAPTSWWAGILGGLSFEYLPHQGYACHAYYFLVAPSCAGIRFMMIAFLMLTVSFLHRIEQKRSGCLWFWLSIFFSYIGTILVNGIRIVASIYLPILLKRTRLTDGFLTPDRLHTLIGTVIYFSSLCIIYLLASAVCRRFFLCDNAEASSAARPFPYRRIIMPAFWYLLTVLVLPFCKRVLTNDWEGFGQYALLVSGACLIIMAVFLFCPFHSGKASSVKRDRTL